MNEIFSRIKVSGRQVATVVAFVVVASVAQMAIPSMLGAMIDKGVGEGRAGLVAGIAVAMVVLSVVACAVNIAAARLAASVTTKFSADLRAELFHKVQTFSAAEIDKFGTASLITRNTTDVTTIQTFATQLLGLGLMAPLMAAVGLALSVAFAGRIAVVIAVAVPVLIVVVTFLIVRASSFSIKLRRKIDDINRLFLETLEGVRVIRAFNRQAHETARFGATNDETARISRSAVAISGLMMPTVVMLFGATSVGAMLVGTALVSNGAMDVGALVAATQYITMILLSIIMIAGVVSLFPDAYACMKRIGEVLGTEPSIKDGTVANVEMLPVSNPSVANGESGIGTGNSGNTGNTPRLRGTVEFRNVTFAYPGADEPVVKGVSFTSRPGETTAIIGRTGSGKSSIVKLIPRLYDTLFGEVLVDGVDVRDYRLADLRAIVGYVPQKNVLFSGDIADNLNFGNEDGAEVDFVLGAGGAVQPVEVKAGAAGRLRSLHQLLKDHPSARDGAVLSSASFGSLPEQRLRFVPIYFAGSFARTACEPSQAAQP